MLLSAVNFGRSSWCSERTFVIATSLIVQQFAIALLKYGRPISISWQMRWRSVFSSQLHYWILMFRTELYWENLSHDGYVERSKSHTIHGCDCALDWGSWNFYTKWLNVEVKFACRPHWIHASTRTTYWRTSCRCFYPPHWSVTHYFAGKLLNTYLTFVVLTVFLSLDGLRLIMRQTMILGERLLRLSSENERFPSPVLNDV